MNDCKFSGVSYERMCEALLRGQKQPLPEALADVGTDGLATLYDIAQIKRYFAEIGKKDVLENGQVNMMPRFDQFTVEDTNVAVFSHCDNPSFNYLWTGEYLGIAPVGHPAEGEFILAKIDGIDDEKRNPHPFGGLFQALGKSDDGCTPGQIIVSKTKYAKVKGITEISKSPNQRWEAGYIVDFEEVNGLMVPVTEGRAVWGYDPKNDPKGYGTICGSYDIMPMCCRPASWNPGIIFNNHSDMHSSFNALRNKDLESLIC